MNKTKQFHSISFLLLKLGVFGLLFYYLYQRLDSVPNGFEIDAEINYVYLTLLVFLMPLNWYMEWEKWNVLLKNENVEPERRKHAFLSGIVSAILTPAYAGNFIGRLFYFPKETRNHIVVNTLVSNASQFLVSIGLGVVSIQLLYFEVLSPGLHILMDILLIGLIGLYYYGEFILSYFPIKYIRKLKEVIVAKKLRSELLALSSIRYGIFIVQFVFALLMFGTPFSLSLVFWIMLMFCAITLSPSLIMGKLLVRETVAVTVLSLIGIPAPIVIMAAFSTWLINQIVPALLATVFIKKEARHAMV